MEKPVKKRWIIALAIAVVIIAIIACCVIFIKDKKPITPEEFKTSMEEKGYIVGDATYQFADYDYIKKAYIAANEDHKYQIEFYELSDVDNAKGFFGSNKKTFENSKGNTSTQSSINLKNHSIYSLKTNGKYKMLSRVENTVIYLNVDEQYKDAVKDIIKELGY